MCQIVTANVISFCRFQDCTQVLHFGLSCWLQSLPCFFFLLTVVDVMIILNKFSHSSPFLVQWFLKYRYSPLTSSVWLLQFTLIHGPNILGSYVILFFTASDFTSITSHIHNWALFLLWLHLFILLGAISLLFSSSILGTYRPGSSSFSVISFCLFILFILFTLSYLHSQCKNTEVVSHSILQFCQTTFCQNSPPWPVCPGWPYTVWLVVSLS